MLAIAAQIPRPRSAAAISRRPIRKTCSGSAATIANWFPMPAQMPYVLENAIRAAVGQRGVAVLVIPGDVALKSAPKRGISPNAGLLPAAPMVRPPRRELAALADTPERRRTRHTVLRPRLRRRACALLWLAETLKSPMVHALGGKEHVEYDNPYDVGMTGFIGFSSGYAAMHACDVLLMLGTDFPLQAVLCRPMRKIAQVDIRPENLGRRCKLDLGLVGDVGATHRGAAAEADGEERPGASRRQPGALQEGAAGARRAGAGTPGRKPIHPQYLAQAGQRGGVGRCRLHLRRRHADDLGGALSCDERAPAPGRFVGARLDGQCACRMRSARRRRSRAGR